MCWPVPKSREFPLPWHNPDPGFGKYTNPAFENLRGAWEQDQFGVELPVAIHPPYVHPRLRAQGSCFTIHGKRKVGLAELLPTTILKRYVVSPSRRLCMLSDLALLGITDTSYSPILMV
jgi:hypothetical protein